MGYRKVHINGTIYEYVVGKKSTKVIGMKPVDNKEIGTLVIDTCSCYAGDPEATCWYYEKWKVTPASVKKFICSKI